MSETARKPMPPKNIQATRRWTWLTALTGMLAVNAFGGAVGLMTGVVDIGTAVSSRFPFHSPVLARLALALVVGVPMSWVTYLAVRRDSKTGAAAVVAGSWLIGWVVIEFGVLRATSWVQPVLAFAGLLVLLVGLHEPDRQRSPGVGRPGEMTIAIAGDRLLEDLSGCRREQIGLDYVWNDS